MQLADFAVNQVFGHAVAGAHSTVTTKPRDLPLASLNACTPPTPNAERKNAASRREWDGETIRLEIFGI